MTNLTCILYKIKQILYCIAATEEPRLYGGCITNENPNSTPGKLLRGLSPYPVCPGSMGSWILVWFSLTSIHFSVFIGFTHLLARRICCSLCIIPTISRFMSNLTLIVRAVSFIYLAGLDLAPI